VKCRGAVTPVFLVSSSNPVMEIDQSTTEPAKCLVCLFCCKTFKNKGMSTVHSMRSKECKGLYVLQSAGACCIETSGDEDARSVYSYTKSFVVSNVIVRCRP